jgi:Bardet-Biedl syndrome 4 protein
MAACQVIQKHGDADVALSKYRIIYGRKPECAQVWNNIGMCFFSKKKFVAAVSCLKRANYLAPFELYVLYNLALVHLYLQQNASAAIFLQSAIRINRKHAASYALLGVALSKLNDPDNALRAYTYSLKLDPTDPMALLNYAIFQTNTGVSQSKIDTTLQEFHQYYAQRAASTSQRELDTSMLDVATKLGASPPLSQSQETFAQHQDDSMPPPSSSTSIFSPRKPFEMTSNDDDDASKQSSQELPVVKTKIYDDGRHKQRRTKQAATALPDAEPVQDESAIF